MYLFILKEQLKTHDMWTYFYERKKGDIFQNEKIEREDWHCFSILQSFLISGLIEDSWTLISASVFSLLQDHMS